MKLEPRNEVGSAEGASIWVGTLPDGHGKPQVAMLWHPEAPFTRTVFEKSLEQGLRTVANDYLAQVRERAGIPRWVTRALQRDDVPHFGWLALAWGVAALEPARRDPRLSFMVAREVQGRQLDRTVVLLGGQRSDMGRSLGGEIGLRVVMHVSEPNEAGRCEVRLTGMSLSNLPALDPGPPLAGLEGYQDAPHAGLPGEALPAGERLTSRTDASCGNVSPSPERGEPSVQVPAALQLLLGDVLSLSRVSVSGITRSGSRDNPVLRLFGAGVRHPERPHAAEPPPVYAFAVELLPAEERLRVLGRVERSAEAVQGGVFLQDPASQHEWVDQPAYRPTAPEERLDALRVPSSRLPGVNTLNPVLGDVFAEVKQSELGQFRPDEKQQQAEVGQFRPDEKQRQALAPSGSLPLRSDQLSEAHALVRALELRDRLERYGLQPLHYFKLARLPLVMRPRAALRGDGQAVNARVYPSGIGPEAGKPWQQTGGRDVRPQVEVHFGAANLWHRSMQPNNAGYLRAQPMGIAADRRWSWHELGHVLNYASIGELEFRFAHSAGDALAAIVADPDSKLAQQPDAEERFQTYPWVQMRRRHNRQACIGWCWCGRRNGTRLTATADSVRKARLGYFEEQLLSSSLFRLYRCIGGDTYGPGQLRRFNASDYVVYLIMRAIALFGPETVVPARSVEHFVAALVDADMATRRWQVEANWPDPEAPPRPVTRIGGCLRKVVRWAFEQQGLYATDDPTATVEGPGRPPAVDLYIPNRRDGGRGGYDPVALDWSRDPDAPPRWHAGGPGIRRRDGHLDIEVGNRGQQPATDVTVAVWFSPLPAPGDAPQWTLLAQGGWAKVPPKGREHLDVPLDGKGPKGQALVWALVSCAADPATAAPLQPEAGLLGERGEELLVDLIANDNNQGLALIDFP